MNLGKGMLRSGVTLLHRGRSEFVLFYTVFIGVVETTTAWVNCFEPRLPGHSEVLVCL